VTLPAFAAECRAVALLLLGAWRLPLLIDISCLHCAQQQTYHMLHLQSNDGTDKQTDRRMLNHYIDHALHTMQAVSVDTKSEKTIVNVYLSCVYFTY